MTTGDVFNEFIFTLYGAASGAQACLAPGEVSISHFYWHSTMDPHVTFNRSVKNGDFSIARLSSFSCWEKISFWDWNDAWWHFFLLSSSFSFSLVQKPLKRSSVCFWDTEKKKTLIRRENERRSIQIRFCLMTAVSLNKEEETLSLFAFNFLLPAYEGNYRNREIIYRSAAAV